MKLLLKTNNWMNEHEGYLLLINDEIHKNFGSEFRLLDPAVFPWVLDSARLYTAITIRQVSSDTWPLRGGDVWSGAGFDLAYIKAVLAAGEGRYLWEGKTLRPFPLPFFNLHHHLLHLTLTAVGPELKSRQRRNRGRHEESRVNIWRKRGQACGPHVQGYQIRQKQHVYKHTIIHTFTPNTHARVRAHTHSQSENPLIMVQRITAV